MWYKHASRDIQFKSTPLPSNDWASSFTKINWRSLVSMRSECIKSFLSTTLSHVTSINQVITTWHDQESYTFYAWLIDIFILTINLCNNIFSIIKLFIIILSMDD